MLSIIALLNVETAVVNLALARLDRKRAREVGYMKLKQRKALASAPPNNPR